MINSVNSILDEINDSDDFFQSKHIEKEKNDLKEKKKLTERNLQVKRKKLF